jgi:hypothetical protein
MIHTQADGFPVTFNFHNAASISGISPTTLRSYLHRELLRHVGQTPLAGQERRFTVTGLIEVALVERFAASGLPLTLASQFADAVLRQSFALVTKGDIGKLDDEQAFSFSRFMKILHDPTADLTVFDQNPRYFMNQEMWSHRDWQEPFVILASQRTNGGVVSAEVVVRKNPSASDIASGGDSVVHVLNLTRLMTNLEMAIEAL